MSRMIDFDESTARAVERMYQTPDVVAQRVRFLEAVALRPGERVLDVGSGPGLLAHEMARLVGEAGRVAGVDPSGAMLEMARKRCDGLPWVAFHEAEAASLPFGAGDFDALVATQVYEYVPEIEQALAEAHRVLRPAGRIWILDTDWDSVVWHTTDRARMRRILDAWDGHLHDAHLPATLAPRLQAAGFQVERQEVIPILNTALHPETYSFGILAAIQGYAGGPGGVGEAEARAWAEELRAHGATGRYFFSVNRYLTGAIRL